MRGAGTRTGARCSAPSPCSARCSICRAGCPAKPCSCTPDVHILCRSPEPPWRSIRPGLSAQLLATHSSRCVPLGETDYRWLTQIDVSLQPTGGTGKLLWHALGGETIELIHHNVRRRGPRRSGDAGRGRGVARGGDGGRPDPNKGTQGKLIAPLRKGRHVALRRLVVTLLC